ncbi:MAG: hypothetical protein MR051_00740, partial [Lentisphaeria bacterium]|nr:hypothetical protein [Lentisphaeria bacterium]
MAAIKQGRWTNSGVIYPSYLWEDEFFSGSGGAISLSKASSSLTGGGDKTDHAYFIGNTATSNGGAVSIIGTGSSASLSYIDFDRNTGGSSGGAMICNGTNITVALENVSFTGNTANQGGAIFNGGTVALTNVLFSGNSATTSGGAIYNKANCTVTLSGTTFYTASDTVNNLGTLRFSGTNYLNASIAGSGTISVEENAVLIFGNTANLDVKGQLTFGGNNAITFAGSARVKYDVVQDLSNVAITVDGSAYVGTTILVAMGVSAIGGYEVIGTENKALFLRVNSTNNNLSLYERAADLKDGDAPVGNYKGSGDSNLITGGTVEVAFFGTTQASGSVRTVFTGGTVVNSTIGGALVLAGSSAGLGAVTLDIHDGVSLLGGTANGGMNYVAGYAYGANASPSARDDAKCLTVDSAVLNLSGSSINGNLYAGAHARKGAWTEVAATTITVIGGIVEKLYGGGWAERYGQSDVGTATVNISGGSINRLYAGGGNGSNAYTYTTTADLTISGGTVDYVFLGGRNINCFVGDATLTITG